MPTLTVESGRLRKLESILYIAAAVAGGWLWFGWSGAVCMTVAAAPLWPSRVTVVSWPSEVSRSRLQVDLTQLYVSWGGVIRRQSLFRDELTAAEFARVRSELKRVAVTTDRSFS